tara:strand:- start:837 stop:998 length:162 start_codon:yes stop_codon:yes gene_type:complete
MAINKAKKVIFFISFYLVDNFYKGKKSFWEYKDKKNSALAESFIFYMLLKSNL